MDKECLQEFSSHTMQTTLMAAIVECDNDKVMGIGLLLNIWAWCKAI